MKVRTVPVNKTWQRSLIIGGLVTACVTLMLVDLPRQARAQDKDSKPKLPSAEQIIKKTIEAQGGRAAFEKLHSRVSRGSVEITPPGLKGPYTRYHATPNKWYETFESNEAGKVEMGGNGSVYWSLSTALGPRLLEGSERAAAVRDSLFNADLFWTEQFKETECVGIEEADGRSCYKVKRTPFEGNPEYIFFDRKTGLPVRMETVMAGPMGEVPVVGTYEDYREVDGVMLSFRATQVVGNLQRAVIKLDKIEHNVDIPAERFAVPPAVQELVDKQGAAGKPKQP